MILIMSEKNDKHADRVESILQENDADYSRLNLDNYSLKSTEIRFEDNVFRIEGPNCSFSTNEIEAVWNRSAHIEQFIENNCPQNADNLLWKERWNNTLGNLISLLESTKWLNFYPDFYAENQFRQYAISKNIGLKWPSYICSNDINYLNSFFADKKERVQKLMDQGCKLKSAGDCFEKCGDKVGKAIRNEMPENNCLITTASYQVRCTVVGNEYFVGKLLTNTNFEGQINNEIQIHCPVIQPPTAIKMKAIQIMTELNLTHGVFDFIVTDKNEWIFDALNPSGQYLWVEDMQSSDISLSIAKWLMINN